jgi:hypothetical protein
MTEPNQDPIVQALVPDPAVGPPSVAVLRGYLGQSTVPERWRLYLSPALDRYVDIPADKILYTSQLPDNRGTRVWIPKTLKLEYTRVVSGEVQAGFLQGSIVGRHLPGAGAALAETAASAQPGWKMVAFDWSFFECFTDSGCLTQDAAGEPRGDCHPQ